ncbi:MAG: hypothetical protein EPO24_05865 [Bacteroidetes bacterium]|nr:MAG: hypothetical protein EPO24_05865 [Bacteroidota bacterium]
MKITFKIIMVLLLVGTATDFCGATITKKLSVQQLSKHSDCIVVGVVSDVKYERSKATGMLITLTTVTLSRTLKGSPAMTVVIQTPGGRENGRTRFVLGMPSFEIGEEVVLFLKKRSLSEYYGVAGWSQGKFTVTKDPTSSQKVAVSDGGNYSPRFYSRNKEVSSRTNSNLEIPLDMLFNDITQSLSSKKGGN